MTHNTREVIEEKESLKDILETELHEMLRITSLMQPNSDAEFIAIALPNLHITLHNYIHQELQQARKQAVRQFAEDLCRVCTKRWPEYGQALPLYSEDVVAIASRYLDQSELDQPTIS